MVIALKMMIQNYNLRHLRNWALFGSKEGIEYPKVIQSIGQTSAGLCFQFVGAFVMH